MPDLFALREPFELDYRVANLTVDIAWPRIRLVVDVKAGTNRKSGIRKRQLKEVGYEYAIVTPTTQFGFKLASLVNRFVNLIS